MARPPPKSQIEREIDENLRRVYKRTVEQEVPERFAALLQKLRQQEQETDE